jgi:hypothetical protein
VAILAADESPSGGFRTLLAGVACAVLTYSGVDPSKWACARDTVSREYGIRIDSDHGEASKRGFTLKWTYEAGAQTLQIQCSKKPFLVPCGVINDRINAAADKCGIAAA